MNEENCDWRVQRYIQNLESVFKQLDAQTAIDPRTCQVLDLARRYFDDAKYFKEEGKLTSALISLGYSEGLLDALRLLGRIAFDWGQSGSGR